MSKKNNDQNQVPEETKEETPEEVTEASQEKQEPLDHRQGGHHQGTAPGV